MNGRGGRVIMLSWYRGVGGVMIFTDEADIACIKGEAP